MVRKKVRRLVEYCDDHTYESGVNPETEVEANMGAGTNALSRLLARQVKFDKFYDCP